MNGLRRSSRALPGTVLLVVLLLLMLGLSGVMAYQATDAAQSEMRSSERALRGYASFATWELARDGQAALRSAMSGTLARGMDAARVSTGGRAADDSAALRRFASGVRGELAAWCGCADAALAFVRIDGDPPADASSGAPATDANADVARWLARAFPSDGRARSPRPTSTGGAGDGVAEVRTATVDGRPVIGVLGRLPAEAGRQARAFAFAVAAGRVAAPVLARVVAGTPLLPPSLRGGASNRAALSIVVTGARGDTVLRSRAEAKAPSEGSWLDAKAGGADLGVAMGPEVADTLGGVLAGFTAHVALRPALVGAVALEAAPRTRFALLLSLFVLSMCLVGVAIVQLQRQHELARMRDDFVSGVSHELRTPLAQIRLFADLLESGRLPPGEQGGRAVRIINEEAQRLTYLVENVLLFARSQRRVGRVSPQPAAMDALVREIAESFAPLARARDVELRVHAQPGVVAPVDRDALRQVMLNLLDNAVKYGPRGQRVTVGLEMDGGRARLRVDDQGPGIPPWERERVWEPYRRLEREASSAVGGCGIGLSVARDLVEQHGGHVRVEDAPGGGARFVVELPGATRADVEPAASDGALDSEEPRWILDGRMAAP
ncbi:MAG: ATP-binding region ATPase domain protein [Gemmatimonadetes bacterium]|nr:ATP-binding region ATPase domain protein [Gemmatimonadota bacterium]